MVRAQGRRFQRLGSYSGSEDGRRTRAAPQRAMPQQPFWASDPLIRILIC